MSAERYPLWCVDRGEDYGETRYVGPYSGRLAAALWQADNGGTLRKCRRVKASEIDFDAEDRVLTDGLDLAACEGGLPVDAWADFDESIVGPSGGADFAAAFWAWADKHLVVEAFVCEGDE